jgi:hypothetical protein
MDTRIDRIRNCGEFDGIDSYTLVMEMVAMAIDGDVETLDRVESSLEEIQGGIQHDQHTTAGFSPGGYVLWEFDGLAWSLKKDLSKSGFGPSSPPTVLGKFRGQIRATMAICLGLGLGVGADAEA